MRTFGLTGGIATGKSTAAALLRARGVPVLDADQVAREVVQPGEPALTELVDAFGPGVLLPDGQLDRAALRARIAVDPDARARVNTITHPRIFARISGWLEAQRVAGSPLAGVEAALMVETGSYRLYDALVVVTCEPARQAARLAARDGGDPSVAAGLIAAQLPLAAKEAVATHLLRNDGDLDALEAQVDALLLDLRSAATR